MFLIQVRCFGDAKDRNPRPRDVNFRSQLHCRPSPKILGHEPLSLIPLQWVSLEEMGASNPQCTSVHQTIHSARILRTTPSTPLSLVVEYVAEVIVS